MSEKDESGNNTPKPEETLDDLAATLDTKAGHTKGEVKDQKTEIDLPDPQEDPKGFKEAVKGVYETLGEFKEFVDSSKEEKSAQKTLNDINTAVDTVASQVEGVDKRLVRAILKDEVDSNPAFKNLWDARDDNPAAFNKALGILSQQYKEQFAPRVDPQIESDQRAFQESVRAARGGNADAIDSQNSEWANKSDDEFDRDFAALGGQGMM